MNKKRRGHRPELEALDGNERQKIYDRARKIRKADRQRGPKPPKKIDIHHWSEEETALESEWTTMRSKTASKSLDDYVEELIEDGELTSSSETGTDDGTDNATEAGTPGVVVHLDAGRMRIKDNDGDEREVHVPTDLRMDSIAVGDEVKVVARGDREELARILPRRTKLSRIAGQNHREHVLAANVDLVVVVTALTDPPLRPRLIDRYLVAIAHGGAKPVICVNKMDLGDGAELDRTLAPYRQLGHPIARVSALEGNGLDDLRRIIRGQTVVFVGHSGVGKSSLLNALADLAVVTGDVTEHKGKGRHTTTSSTLYELEDGTSIIDTPGTRTFALAGIDASEIVRYFPEFDDHRCRFGDCRHLQEPGCGVKEAVARGDLGRHRYETYVKLLAE